MKSFIFRAFFATLFFISLGVEAQDITHRAVVFKADNSCIWYTPQSGVLVGDLQINAQYAGGPFPQHGKLTCHGTHSLELDSPIVVRNDACVANGVVTDDSLFVATPGGEWVVQCKFKKSNP